MDIYKVSAHSLCLFLVLFFLFVSASEHQHVFVSALRLFRVSINHSGYLFVQNSIMNVSLFGVKIFVKGRPDDAVVVYGYAELLCKLVQVG